MGNTTKQNQYDPEALVCWAEPQGPLGLDVSHAPSPEILSCDVPGQIGIDDIAAAQTRSVSSPGDGAPTIPQVKVKEVVDNITSAIDNVPQLKDSAVMLQLPFNQPVMIRGSSHKSGLETQVKVIVGVEAPVPGQRTWWEQYNGIVLNCSGAAISWVAVGLSGAAEVPSLGTSTVLLVASYASAVATSTQCGLAIGKEASDDFAEYVQTEDGEWVNTADIILDVISVAGGITGAVAAVNSGGKLLQTTKYANRLSAGRKADLVKHLRKLEKVEKDMKYFRESVEKLIKMGKVDNPAGNFFSNNLVKRALPIISGSLKKEVLAGLGDVIAASFSTTSSYYGGAGSKGWGILKISIEVYQETI